MIRRTGRGLVHLFGTLLAGVAVLGVLAAWRLASGPVPVNVLTPYLEEALYDPETGLRVEIGDTVLVWDGADRSLDIRARRVQALGQGGRPVASVPELGLHLALPALLRGRLQLRQLDLIGPQLHVVRTEDGRFVFDIRAADPPADPGAGTRFATELLTALVRPPGARGPLGVLTEVTITDAGLTVDNREVGLSWRAQAVDIALRRDVAGVRGRLDLRLVLARHAVPVSATLDFRAATGITRVEARLGDVQPAELARLSPRLEPLSALTAPVGGQVSLDLDSAFHVAAARFRLTTGAGTLTLPALFEEPVALAFAELQGGFHRAQRRVTLDDLFADLGGPVLRAAATMVDLGDRVDLKAQAALEGMPVDDLRRHWPIPAIPNARRWVTENLSQGLVHSAQVTVDAEIPHGGAPDAEPLIHALDGEIRFDGVNVRYFKPLPPVTGVAGVAAFNARTFGLVLAGGRLGALTVGRTEIDITGLDTRDQAIDIRVPVAGPVPEMLALLDRPPLGYPSRLGLDPARSAGRAEVRARFRFPLIDGLTIDDVEVTAEAELDDLAIDDVVPGIPLTGGRLQLALEPGRLRAAGQARLAGVPADLTWQENFRPVEGVRTRVELAGTLSDADRERLGLSLAPHVTGPVPVTGLLTVPAQGVDTLAVEADLTPATLVLSPLGWIKPAGQPGQARFVAEFARGGPARLRDLTVAAGGLTAAGQVILDPATRTVVRVELARVRLGATRLAAALHRHPDGSRELVVDGESLDARPLMTAHRPLTEPGDGADVAVPGAPLTLRVDLDEILLGEDRRLLGVAAVAVHDGQRLQRLDLDGSTGQGGTVLVRYGPAGGRQRLEVRSDDAGSALRILALSARIEGGSLTILGEGPPGDPDGPLEGRIGMRDFVVRDAPVLARLLNAASPRGFAELMDGGGLRFDRLDGAWHYEDSQLEIRTLRLSGASLGLTADGRIDLAARSVDVDGTIVPLYGLNSLLSNVPVLGDILTGGKGQGIFAATYHIDGPLREPTVRVNPVAMLTPGFLRDLLFLGEGAEGPPPEPAQPWDNDRD